MLLNMGQNNSLPKPRRRSIKSPFLTKRNHKTALSHTFSLPHDDQKIEQLNINLATEEELMTLSGITRQVARAIVKHRQLIGRFRKVEDLALVGGIGAEKLEKIKGEVCVRNNSCNSSRAQSVDSLSTDTKLTTKLIDINKANVFELQCVYGMTQEMAANIVHYRNKKGPFKKLDDLLKVRSVNQMRLSNMCHQLTISIPDNESNLSRTTSASQVLTNGNSIIPNGTSTPIRHRKTVSAPVKLHVANGLPSQTSLGDIFDLLSAYSYRPIPEEDFKYKRNGKDAFRIATWNLHEFTYEKAQNLGVREVICRTILENHLSIVCIQEVYEEEALQLVCDELNFPGLRKVAEFRTNSKDWHFKIVDSHLGFIYDAYSGGLGIEITNMKDEMTHDYSVAIAEFYVGLNLFTLINVDIPDNIQKDIVQLKLKEIMTADEFIFILGDFTNYVDKDHHFDDCESVVPVNTNTACTTIKCKYSDNILISKSRKCSLTGLGSIVRQGLTHLAIPNGWSWGGPVSPHCPLWTEIYVDKPLTNGF